MMKPLNHFSGLNCLMTHLVVNYCREPRKVWCDTNWEIYSGNSVALEGIWFTESIFRFSFCCNTSSGITMSKQPLLGHLLSNFPLHCNEILNFQVDNMGQNCTLTQYLYANEVLRFQWIHYWFGSRILTVRVVILRIQRIKVLAVLFEDKNLNNIYFQLCFRSFKHLDVLFLSKILTKNLNIWNSNASFLNCASCFHTLT